MPRVTIETNERVLADYYARIQAEIDAKYFSDEVTSNKVTATTTPAEYARLAEMAVTAGHVKAHGKDVERELRCPSLT